MPQITINEIDQSVFTRVINDDKVKVLVPGIASFGPVYDGSEDSAVTFTDVTAFNKVFGYTEPEYNPFPDDVSRTYAKQLIDRGAAVTFVRVNNGTKATFNMTIRSQKAGETDVVNYVPVDAAIVGNEPTYTVVSTKPADWSTKYYVNYYTKSTASDGTDTYTRVPQFTLVINGTEAPSGWPTGYYTKETAGYTAVPAGTTWSATGTYYTANPVADNAQWPATTYYTMNDTYKYMFAEQIEGIEAKYTGTFGNHLLVTFSPIDSPNVVFPYQYSLVCVYRADILVKSTKTPTADGYVVKSSKVITGVHKLEDHIVTTNPNDVNYIEDVEFNYINFVLTPSARDEFAVAWSNRL